jgi:hypothetical protein
MIMKSRWAARAGAVPATAVALLFLAGTALAAPATWTLQEPPAPSGAADPALLGVSCASASACVAVGNDTQSAFTDIWDGTSWATATFPDQSESYLDSVSCLTSSDCTAVGSVADTAEPGTIFPLALNWDGTSWTVQTVPEPAGDENGILTGVSCPSATRCMAVTNSEYTELWNGSVWKTRPVGVPALSGVSCTSAMFCVAVGGNDASAEFWNGSAWTAMTVPTPPGQSYGGFYSVSCGSVSSCTAVGSYYDNGVTEPLADHWNGTSWSQQTLATVTGFVRLVGVSCARPGNDCTAVGSVETAKYVLLVEHWNGTEWTRVRDVTGPPESGTGLNSVSCHTAATCVAVGTFDTRHTGVIGLLAEQES